MEDVTVVKIVRVADLEASDTYEVTQHEDSDEWLVFSTQLGGEAFNMRKETAVIFAKAILEVFG